MWLCYCNDVCDALHVTKGCLIHLPKNAGQPLSQWKATSLCGTY